MLSFRKNYMVAYCAMSASSLKHVHLARPNVGSAELKSIERVFESGILTEGEACAELERRFARYIGCRYAMAASSCTSALQLAVIASGICPGDEVLVPDNDMLRSVDGIVAPYSRKGNVHTYQSYVVAITKRFGRDRDSRIRRLVSKGVDTQVGTYALHVQPAFKDPATRGRYPNSRFAYATSLSLPISSIMKAFPSGVCAKISAAA